MLGTKNIVFAMILSLKMNSLN